MSRKRVEETLSHTDVLDLIRRVEAIDKTIDGFKWGRYPGWHKQVRRLLEDKASLQRKIDDAPDEAVEQAYDKHLRGA